MSEMHKGCDHTHDFEWIIVALRCRTGTGSNAHFGRSKPEENSDELSATKLIAIA